MDNKINITLRNYKFPTYLLDPGFQAGPNSDERLLQILLIPGLLEKRMFQQLAGARPFARLLLQAIRNQFPKRLTVRLKKQSIIKN